MMIALFLAAASPQLDAKADYAFFAGFCHNSGWTVSEALEIEQKVRELPSNDYERGYLSVAFDEGRLLAKRNPLTLANTKRKCEAKLFGK